MEFQMHKRQPQLQPSCETQEGEDLLSQQLGEFWSYAVDRPNRFNNHHHQIESNNNEENCSLEQQFLYQDFLTRPVRAILQRKKTTSSLLEPQSCLLRGEDIKDVPTTYVISGLESHEIPVIGTYVDRRILTGFMYKVRLNQTEKFLFDGKALCLQGIGMGYGKRLTFEDCRSLNNNSNYFWSDNRPEGFAFSLIAIQPGDRFSYQNDQKQDLVLRVDLVLSQKEITTSVLPNGDIVKNVLVDFTFSSIANEIRVSGIALIVKAKGCRKGKLDMIQVDHPVFKKILKPIIKN